MTGRSSQPDAPSPQGSSSRTKEGHPFPIAAIGASAGGLKALTELFSNLPSGTGMAFLVVQHLDPTHESHLPELLEHVSRMEVAAAEHGEKVERDRVYVIPPNALMSLADGILHLSPREGEKRPNLSIDYLFRSLAEDRKSQAIGVVLSGAGADGTQGVCEIKAVGGITFAQDERTAEHPGMPHSAIESGCVDFVLAPADIARRLAEIGGHPYMSPAAAAEVEQSAEDNYRSILASVRAATAVDFTHYRDTTIKRRIMRRMALHSQRSLTEYADRLKTDSTEVEALYKDLLINVTSFFRDAEMFEALKSTVFPELIQGRPPSQPFRVWTPGCSTGQEAYSMAMALVEFFDGHPVRPPIQIFATDLDQAGLDRARVGVYPEGIEQEVSPERLRRFFHREDHVYRIDKFIRDMCVFARHNVTADPPFSHLDLISCRNVLIYLTTPLQKRVLSAFHYALNAPGILALGNAESVGDMGEFFEIKDRVFRIYTKKAAGTRHAPFFTAGEYRSAAVFSATRPGAHLPSAPDFQKEADRILLGRYAPPAVLLDENFNILQFRGRTGAYLESPPGEPTTNIFKMVREGLFLELRNALNEAKKSEKPVRREGVRVRSNGNIHDIGLEVVPLRAQSGGICYLLLFQDPAAQHAAVPEKPPAPPSSSDELEREVVQLRQELAATREYLQSMTEQQDAANEELRSANEEILSSNEELQSTNEELETAKEELQSVNEELTTVNEQLTRRNQELNQATNDVVNLLSSTNIPVVMVSGDHRIRRFTPATRKIMGLLPTDIGRPISDIRPAFLVPDLENLIAEVIETVHPIEREVRDREGRWFVLRLHPYRTSDNKIDGAVISLIDIDQIKRTQEELQSTTAQLERRSQLIELSQDAIVIRDAGNRVLFWNRGAEEMYGWPAEEARGKMLDQLLHIDAPVWEGLNEQLDRKGTWEGELRQTRRHGSTIVVHVREVLVRDESGARSAVLSIKRDITGAKQMIETLKMADRRKDEFLATLAHELRNPLAPIRNAVEILRRSQDPQVLMQNIELLDRQVQQLSSLIEDLIDVARISEGKIELKMERIDVREVIAILEETCRAVIEARRQRLSVAMPPEPLCIEADRTRMCEILINLVQNASKFTRPGGNIWVTAEWSDAGSQSESGAAGRPEVVLRVRDDGIGIPAELLPRIFDMFTQGRRVTDEGRGGLGIGLTVVRSLVHKHGGTIEAHSEGTDKGSEFVIRLPLIEAPPGPAKSAASDSLSPSAGPRSVLVVDDNPDQVESLAMLLGLMGHEVYKADCGAEALRALDRHPVDVALIDIDLPGVDGYEVARRIRRDDRFRHTLLVAQTGWGQGDDRARSSAAGFDYHLVKPLTPEALAGVIGHHGPTA